SHTPMSSPAIAPRKAALAGAIPIIGRETICNEAPIGGRAQPAPDDRDAKRVDEIEAIASKRQVRSAEVPHRTDDNGWPRLIPLKKIGFVLSVLIRLAPSYLLSSSTGVSDSIFAKSVLRTAATRSNWS